MSEPMTLTVFGAEGGVGAHVVEQALARGHIVRGVDMDPPQNGLQRERLSMHKANVLSDDLDDVIAGSHAVISALGLPLGPQNAVDPPPLYTEGTLRIVQAMRRASLRRLVVISATFVASMERGPLVFQAAARLSLTKIFNQMGDMERILRASEGIEWTAVRPGWLMEAPLTEDYVVTSDVVPPELIRTRAADVADLMLRCVEEGLWINQTPAIARAEDAAATSPAAVLREALS